MAKKVVYLTAIIILVLTGTGCQNNEENNQNNNASTVNTGINQNVSVQPVNTNSNPITDWQAYFNNDYSYQIKYPNDWHYHTTACCPPPPAYVIISTAEDGVTEPPYANLLISVSERTGETLETHTEISSLTEDGYSKTETTIDGEKAYRLERRELESDNGGSIYTYKDGYFYRFNYGATNPELYAERQDTLELIINSFEFLI